MTEQRPSDGNLDELLQRTLRELPLRQAPRRLEARVLDAIERRAARPWWQRGFAYWPDLARSVFVLACAGLIWVAALEGIWALGVLGSPRGPLAVLGSWAREAAAFAGTLGEILTVLGHAVPSSWLSGGLALSAVLYAVVFGLGIAAYRILHLDSRTLGNIES